MPNQQTTSRYTNRLIHETSPYLLQHAHNPVNWHPWGNEAFELARRQDKPIFLSIGYSTCYWCHVMERESFENLDIARLLNDRFVCIKVDREERPDIDQLYMTAVQVLTHRGGWPMTVFLTPDLKPFYGGTYFPPTDIQGHVGLDTLLRSIDDAYHNRKGEVLEGADQLIKILDEFSRPVPIREPVVVDEDWIAHRIEQSTSDYDGHNGGFGSSPKFPRETLLLLLLEYCSSLQRDPDRLDSRRGEKRSHYLQMVCNTLDKMAMGGVRDHLGGGFHRYSTDARWRVPHFEIMLYNNALLARAYLEAYRQTEDMNYARIARQTMDFVLREMTSPQGGFYSAIDAETDAVEGATYLWTPKEVEKILNPADAKLFNRAYGLDEGYNFSDPHHGNGLPDRNVLFLPRPMAEIASEMKMDEEHLAAQLNELRQKLLAARSQRPQPRMDHKVLTSWNALMIHALAYGGQLLNEPRYLDAAARAANYLLKYHRKDSGILLRSTRPDLQNTAEPSTVGQDKSAHHTTTGFIDDYAFFIQALIMLRDASGDETWQEHAALLTMTMLERFGDTDNGGFYFTDKDQSDLLIRQKTAADNPLPGGNAIAGSALLDLGYPQHTRGILSCFASSLTENVESCSALLQLAIRYVQQFGKMELKSSAPDQAGRPLSMQSISQGVVNLSATWADDTTLKVLVKILPGFHINSHTTDKMLLPTDLTVEGESADTVKSIDYPAGRLTKLAFAHEPIAIYEGEVSITVNFHEPVQDKPVKLNIRYQACDDSACLLPVTRTLTVGAM